MENFNHPDFKIYVQQYAILTGDTDKLKAQLLLSHNDFELEILGEETFQSLNPSTTCYELVIEYNKESTYQLWTMTLEDNDMECNDFIIKKNQDYHSLIEFIKKLKLHDKLEVQFIDKSFVKKSKI